MAETQEYGLHPAFFTCGALLTRGAHSFNLL